MSDIPGTNAERVVWQAAFEVKSNGRVESTNDAAMFADDVLDFLREVENDVWEEVGQIERDAQEG